MQNKNLEKICAMALAGSIVLTSTGFAVSAKATTSPAATAATSTTSSTLTAAARETCGKGLTQAETLAGLLADLKVAVTANIITQAESDQIQAFVTAKTKTDKKGLFKVLVTKGILTQTKADALKVSFKAQRELKRQEELKTAIAKFVTDKTITQDQADKILAAINAAEAARKAAFDKAATMSKADAKAYLDNFRKTEVNPLATLVTAGAITQTQADKLGKAIHEGKGPGCGKGPRDGRGCGMAPAD